MRTGFISVPVVRLIMPRGIPAIRATSRWPSPATSPICGGLRCRRTQASRRSGETRRFKMLGPSHRRMKTDLKAVPTSFRNVSAEINDAGPAMRFETIVGIRSAQNGAPAKMPTGSQRCRQRTQRDGPACSRRAHLLARAPQKTKDGQRLGPEQIERRTPPSRSFRGA